MIIKNIENEKRINDETYHKIMGLIDELHLECRLSKEDYLYMLNNITAEEAEYLHSKASEVAKEHYGNTVYMRGLIEFSNYCMQNCNYCGIRLDNNEVDRYRLTKEDILKCARLGYDLGYRTFVLQSGEDPYFNVDRITDIVREIKRLYPECAVTLSMGEKTTEEYEAYYKAGADRYLLRHEAASHRLYEHLHPNTMDLDNRLKCLNEIKKIGFQVGCGFMVGSPTQTNEDLVEDLLYVEELMPHMCGIGPYISHSETPLKGNRNGTVPETRVMLSLVRLINPKVLLPSTTALGTIDKLGREKALKAGANVVMPNLSPTDVREKYELYENKICTGDEAAHCRGCIERRINFAGFEVDMSRGDHVSMKG